MTPYPPLGPPFPPYQSFVQPATAWGCGFSGATLEVAGKVAAGTDPVPAPCYGTSTARDTWPVTDPPTDPTGSGYDWTADVEDAQSLADAAQDDCDAASAALATALLLNNWVSVTGAVNTTNAGWLTTYALKCQWHRLIWLLPDPPDRTAALAQANVLDPDMETGGFYAGVQNFLNVSDGAAESLCSLSYSASGGYLALAAVAPGLLPGGSTPEEVALAYGLAATFEAFTAAVAVSGADFSAWEAAISAGPRAPAHPVYTNPGGEWDVLISRWKLLDAANTHLAAVKWRRDNDDGRGGVIYEDGFAVGGVSPAKHQKVRLWKTWPEPSVFSGVLNHSIYDGSTYSDQSPLSVTVGATDGTPADVAEAAFTGDGGLGGGLAVNEINFVFSTRIAQISMVRGELGLPNYPAWTAVPSDGSRWFATITASGGAEYTGSLTPNDLTGLLPQDMSDKARAFLVSAYPAMPPGAIPSTLTATSASWILSPTVTLTLTLSGEITTAAISARCDALLDLGNPDTMGAGNASTPQGVTEYGTWVSNDQTAVRKAVSDWTAISVLSASATWDKFSVTPTGLTRSTRTLTGSSPDAGTLAPETYYTILANGSSTSTTRETAIGEGSVNWPCS